MSDDVTPLRPLPPVITAQFYPDEEREILGCVGVEGVYHSYSAAFSGLRDLIAKLVFEEYPSARVITNFVVRLRSEWTGHSLVTWDASADVYGDVLEGD